MRANWLPGDRFWYRNQTATGIEFILVDAAKATRAPAFDHAAVATGADAAMGKPVTTERLPFQQITFAADLQSFSFDSDLKRWTCDVRGKQCTSADRPAHRRQQRPVARRQARRIHPRLQPLGPRPRHRRRQTAHHRRREGLRLRHRQRRLALQRSPGARLVARLEEDRHLPAGPAQDRRDVPRQHHRRPSHAAGVEVPAARRRRTSP